MFINENDNSTYITLKSKGNFIGVCVQKYEKCAFHAKKFHWIKYLLPKLNPLLNYSYALFISCD